jgi:hypothetical protein
MNTTLEEIPPQNGLPAHIAKLMPCGLREAVRLIRKANKKFNAKANPGPEDFAPLFKAQTEYITLLFGTSDPEKPGTIPQQILATNVMNVFMNGGTIHLLPQDAPLHFKPWPTEVVELTYVANVRHLTKRAAQRQALIQRQGEHLAMAF